MFFVVSVAFGAEPQKPLPVTIQVTAPRVSVKHWEEAVLIVRTTNTSAEPLLIGTEFCGLPGVVNWTADNAQRIILLCGGACHNNLSTPVDIVLKPSETYEQDCSVRFPAGDFKAGPVDFRIGLKTEGYLTAWSDNITLRVEGGPPDMAELQQKREAYQRDFTAKGEVSQAPDGVIKRYYETGELYDERTVKDGKLNGVAKIYTKGGKLRQETIYRDNAAVRTTNYNGKGVAYDADADPGWGALHDKRYK